MMSWKLQDGRQVETDEDAPIRYWKRGMNLSSWWFAVSTWIVAGVFVFLLILLFVSAVSTAAEYWLDIGPDGSTKIRFNLPTRIASGVGMEFGHSDSSIQGDSGTIWIKTRDDIIDGTERIGLISDHDGFSGVGVFDSINNWELWQSERPDGPEAGDTIAGVAHFFMLAVAVGAGAQACHQF